jgi:hypothetical protein
VRFILPLTNTQYRINLAKQEMPFIYGPQMLLKLKVNELFLMDKQGVNDCYLYAECVNFNSLGF